MSESAPKRVRIRTTAAGRYREPLLTGRYESHKMNESSELTIIDPKSVEATSFSVKVHSELPMKAY